MYKIIPTQSVPYNPALLRIGLPIMEHTNPNLIIVSANNSNYLAINATVLREALLNSPELLKESLGLEVKDLRKKSVPSQDTSKPAEPKKKKTSKKAEEIVEVTTSENIVYTEETSSTINEQPAQEVKAKEEDEWV